MFTKKEQQKKAPGKEGGYVFSVKTREGNKTDFHELTESKISPILGGLLLFAGGFVLLFSGIYALTIWWSIIPQFEFWEFMGAVILFPITIPLSPIYLGVQGDWEPTAVFIVSMTLGFLLIVIGNRFYRLSGGDSSGR